MRPSLLLLCVALGPALPTQAQLFVELHGSYLLPLSGYGMNSSTEEEITSELLNFGRGGGGGLAVGVALTEVLGVEARFTYVSGTEQVLKDEYSGMYNTSSSTQTWKTSYLRFEPALRASFGSGTVRGYVAVGPSLTIGTKLTAEFTDDDSYHDPFYPESSFTSAYDSKEENTGGIGWGGFGAIGFTWSNGGAFGLFAEVQATAQTWSPKEGKGESRETTHYFDGSVNSYSDSYTVDYVDSYKPDEEDKSTKLHLPMSTWGARAGVRFIFGGKA